VRLVDTRRDAVFQRIIVPIDGSTRSWHAACVGQLVADQCEATFEVVTVVADARQVQDAHDELKTGLEELGEGGDRAIATVLLADFDTDDTVGDVIGRHLESVPGSMLVMSSTGRGRSAAVVGSVVEDVLRSTFGPMIVVGPHVPDSYSFAGDIIVPVDGSEFSETSLPLAAAWGIGFGATPWIVEVLTEPIPAGLDVYESSYAHRLATDLHAQSHHDVEFEVLHGRSASRAIVDFADGNGARLVVMSTHGRTGLQRLAVGSTAADVVHHATCPVVLHRPPRFTLE
jgi:nucleotide-binding universal stress UspA family protein